MAVIAILAPSAKLLAWAAPTLGVVFDCANSGSTCVNSLTGLTDTSALLVLVGQVGSDANATYAVTETEGLNAYTEWSLGEQYASNNRGCNIFTATNITTSSGALTVTVTVGNGTPNFRVMIMEVVGAATSSLVDVVDSLDDGASVNNHPMASPGLTTLTDVFIAGIWGGASQIITYTAASDFTSRTADFPNTATTAQYISSSPGRTSETATWNGTTAGEGMNCLISVKSPTSAAQSGESAVVGKILGGGIL